MQWNIRKFWSILVTATVIATIWGGRSAEGAVGTEVSDFGSELRTALATHEEASDLAGELLAREQFADLTARYPDRWLGFFWSAYVESQIARIYRSEGNETELSASLARAMPSLDRAVDLEGGLNARSGSSFAMLKALLYRFHPKTDHTDWAPLVAAATDQAVRLEPDNPVVLVVTGIRLLGSTDNPPSLWDLVAARSVLERAKVEADGLEDRSQTTYFNSEWLDYWLPRAREALSEKVAGESSASVQ